MKIIEKIVEIMKMKFKILFSTHNYPFPRYPDEENWSPQFSVERVDHKKDREREAASWRSSSRLEAET